MFAKEIVEIFSKEDPNKFFIMAWWEPEEFIDEEDGITQKVWDQKAPSYNIEWAVEEYDAIHDYLKEESDG